MRRPHKPTELLILTGGYRPDRHARCRAAPKSPHPIGDPPACLAPDEAGCWAEFVSNAPAGVLTSNDRVALEGLSRLHAKSRREGLTGAEWSVLRRLLGDLGATPASRGRVLPVESGAEASPTGNPWDVPMPGRA